jgi:hypothetical protein
MPVARRCVLGPPGLLHQEGQSGLLLSPPCEFLPPRTGAAARASPSRSRAPDIPPTCGDSRPDYPQRCHASPLGRRRGTPRWPRELPHYRCGCHHAGPHGGVAHHPHAPRDSGAPVCARHGQLYCAPRQVVVPPPSLVRLHTHIPPPLDDTHVFAQRDWERAQPHSTVGGGRPMQGEPPHGRSPGVG